MLLENKGMIETFNAVISDRFKDTVIDLYGAMRDFVKTPLEPDAKHISNQSAQWILNNLSKVHSFRIIESIWYRANVKKRPKKQDAATANNKDEKDLSLHTPNTSEDITID